MARKKERYFTDLAEGITINNCNGRIKFLEKRQSQMSDKMDRAIIIGDNNLAGAYEVLYNCMGDILDQLIEFRKNNDCLLEGDPGYEAL